jgi:hypothetical protein
VGVLAVALLYQLDKFLSSSSGKTPASTQVVNGWNTILGNLFPAPPTNGNTTLR